MGLDKQVVVIHFTESQKSKLARQIGVSADGLQVNPTTRSISLLNPGLVELFRLEQDQRDILRDNLGKDCIGLAVNSVGFGVDLITADDVTIQMWGEYRS